jgi:hypothetical protein
LSVATKTIVLSRRPSVCSERTTSPYQAVGVAEHVREPLMLVERPSAVEGRRHGVLEDSSVRAWRTMG